jgi:cytochrome c553
MELPMKHALLPALILLATPALAAEPFVDGNAESGAGKAAVCAACHGPGGNSINPEWPSLAGQSARYLFESLQEYKSGERKDPLMMGQVAALSEQDKKDLAVYFSQQTPKPGVASEEAIDIAGPLYRGGDAERGIAACAACHGPRGLGNPGAGYPRLSGQHAAYSAVALRHYRAGERAGSRNGQMMTAVAKPLTDEEIEALASYISGLQ